MTSSLSKSKEKKFLKYNKLRIDIEILLTDFSYKLIMQICNLELLSNYNLAMVNFKRN